MIFEKIEITKESFLNIRIHQPFRLILLSMSGEALKVRGSKFYYYNKHSVGRLYTKEGEKCYCYVVNTIEGLDKSIINYWNA